MDILSVVGSIKIKTVIQPLCQYQQIYKIKAKARHALSEFATPSNSNRKLKDLIRVNDLVKYFPVRAGVLKRTVAWVQAVDGVSFTIKEGETIPVNTGGDGDEQSVDSVPDDSSSGNVVASGVSISLFVAAAAVFSYLS